ncbi:unnamed protein product, partial [Dicrocoelium dendriticum]
MSLADTPTVDETQRALVQLRNGRCAGADWILPEILKRGRPTLVNVLHHLMQRKRIEKELPTELKDAIALPMYRAKGSTHSCTNYCGIKSLSCV